MDMHAPHPGATRTTSTGQAYAAVPRPSPIAAKQLLMSGITTARELGAPLEDILEVKRRIEKGEIPGPRLFVSGPFIQRAPYADYEKTFRWGVSGPEDARAKVQKLVDAGVDVIKLIDQDQCRGRPRGRGHRAQGRPVVAHGHREDEIRMACATARRLLSTPARHRALSTRTTSCRNRKRNNTLYWCPTIEPVPRRLHGSHLPGEARRPGLAEGHSQGHRRRHPPFAAEPDVSRLLHAHVPPPAHARQQVPPAPRDGGHPARGHRQRHPRQLPHRLDVARCTPGSSSA
jgi:hypothetical protein